MRLNKAGEQKSYRLFGLFNFALVLLVPSLCLASFEDFKRQQESSFTQYKDKKDAAFNKYLKAQWEEYTAKESLPLYEKAKPKSIEPTVAKKIQSVGPMVLIKLDKEPAVEPVINIIKVVTPVNQADIRISFFGEDIGLNVDESIKKAKFYPYSQVGISNFFDSVAVSDYDDLLRSIKSKSNELDLNDWGKYLLVMKISEAIFEVEDDAKLFAWFVLNKLGYNVKVGLSSNHIVLMHYSEKIIYSTPNYSFGKKHFYVISNYAKGKSGRVFTYAQDYPDATKPLDLALVKIPKFTPNTKNKLLSFKQYGKEYKVPVSYNQNLIDFMATYPQADYETYFNAPMQESTYEQIAKEMKAYIDGKQASVAMNFVLNFVQNAFVYEQDNQQFGREKVMFAEETLYYDKSDCEDRAILFSYLVKRLFKVGVIGVKYKDHMATALYIPMRGDSVKAGKKEFVIADPTYINANIGQSMPRYKSKIPQSFIVVQREDI